MGKYTWRSLLLPLLAFEYAPAAATLGYDDADQEPLVSSNFDTSACPDYALYSQYAQ